MLVCVFGGSTVLGAGVRVVAERIGHETATVAEAMRPSQSGNVNAEELFFGDFGRLPFFFGK